MFPQVGDSVKFTDSFFQHHSQYTSLYWVGPYHNVELEVLSVDLFTMTPQAIYYVYIAVNGILQRVSVDDKGLFVRDNGVRASLTVFEAYHTGAFVSSFSVSLPSIAGTLGGVPAQPKTAPNEDERCKKCGTMGEASGMCGKCPGCGNIIWGM